MFSPHVLSMSVKCAFDTKADANFLTPSNIRMHQTQEGVVEIYSTNLGPVRQKLDVLYKVNSYTRVRYRQCFLHPAAAYPAAYSIYYSLQGNSEKKDVIHRQICSCRSSCTTTLPCVQNLYILSNAGDFEY